MMSSAFASSRSNMTIHTSRDGLDWTPAVSVYPGASLADGVLDGMAGVVTAHLCVRPGQVPRPTLRSSRSTQLPWGCCMSATATRRSATARLTSLLRRPRSTGRADGAVGDALVLRRGAAAPLACCTFLLCFEPASSIDVRCRGCFHKCSANVTGSVCARVCVCVHVCVCVALWVEEDTAVSCRRSTL